MEKFNAINPMDARSEIEMIVSRSFDLYKIQINNIPKMLVQDYETLEISEKLDLFNELKSLIGPIDYIELLGEVYEYLIKDLGIINEDGTYKDGLIVLYDPINSFLKQKTEKYRSILMDGLKSFKPKAKRNVSAHELNGMHAYRFFNSNQRDTLHMEDLYPIAMYSYRIITRYFPFDAQRTLNDPFYQEKKMSFMNYMNTVCNEYMIEYIRRSKAFIETGEYYVDFKTQQENEKRMMEYLEQKAMEYVGNLNQEQGMER